MRTKISVNINKVALIRNSRGGNLPDLRQFAIDCEAYGADGITVHPRPDERHVRYSDLAILNEANTTEFNVEGYPSEKFLDIVCSVRPTQCTLVPDPPGVLTSSEGWDVTTHKNFLQDVVARLQAAGIRVSLFLQADEADVQGAALTGTDRIEFYTGDYAHQYGSDPIKAVESHVKAAQTANSIGLGINAGHDLNLDNLKFYAEQVTGLKEVSIGHALVSDALYYGISNTINMYKALL